MNRIIVALLLLAAPAVAEQYDPRHYGAAGNGITLDTAAIQKAIDAASAVGGGTVTIPAGTYLTGTILLRNNITLSLEPGATLLGSRDMAQYQTSRGTDEWYKALILAKGVHNVSVVGRGTVDGNRAFNPKGEEHMRGPHGILFDDCTNVTVRDIHVKDAGNYAVILRAAQGITIDGLTVHGGWDGINMHDARDATISNCRLYTGDDSLAGAYWENVTVTNCILNSSCNPVRVGGRNVLITNCVMYGPPESVHGTSLRRHTEAGFQILPHHSNVKNKYVQPGPVDNMVLANNTMIGMRTPFFVAYSADAPYSANNLGVNRIVIDGLTVIGAGRTPFYVSAPATNPAKSIIVRNVRMNFTGGGAEAQAEGQGFSPFSILQSYAFYMRNVDHLELHDVRVDYTEPDTRPAIFGENIGLLELDRFHAKREPGAAPFLELAGKSQVAIDGKEAQLTEVSLDACGKTLSRIVSTTPGEKPQAKFLNLRCNPPAKPEGNAPAAPYQTFHNVAADLLQTGKDSFYIRAAGDFTVMEYGDQYGTIYKPQSLPETGTITVQMDNPDLKANWVGRAGIMVRKDMTRPDESPAYLTLSSSPADGAYLEWDSKGNGRLDSHTEINGYSIWPHWLKLERNGTHFTGYKSQDGKTWTKIGEAEVPTAKGPLDAGIFCYRSSAAFKGLSYRP